MSLHYPHVADSVVPCRGVAELVLTVSWSNGCVAVYAFVAWFDGRRLTAPKTWTGPQVARRHGAADVDAADEGGGDDVVPPAADTQARKPRRGVDPFAPSGSGACGCRALWHPLEPVA
jgi:hypothetical protein